MTDLMDDFVRARLEPIRDQLWAHGEITIAGLRRLDKALGVDTYSRGNVTATDKTERALSEMDAYKRLKDWCIDHDLCMFSTLICPLGTKKPSVKCHECGREVFFGSGCTAERYTEASE